ncbi:MAG: NYN domain-containing protein [bacterium]|nr:NYN domain-containing protein [bacterium]
MLFGKTERVAIYIDGSNTYNKLKVLGIPEEEKRFNYETFVTHLIGARKLVSKRYYVGIVRNYDHSEKSEKLVRKQQQFLERLRLTGFDIKPGKIMYDGIGRIREKGVDVKLAIDLVIGAADNLYDTAIVISSDTDLIPAIKYVLNGKKKKVEYVGFAGAPSLGMIKECSSQRLFAKEDLLRFQSLKEPK